MIQKDSVKYIVYFLLSVILAIGLLLRVEGIRTGSFAFTYDVGRDLLAVSDIVNNHKIPLIGQTTGLPGLFYGPWWYYLLTIPFILSSGNPSGVLFFIVITGLVTILLGYVLGKMIDGDFLGILIASFISFSPVMVGITSQIWNPNIAPIFLILLYIIFFKIFFCSSAKITKNVLWFFLGLLLALSLDVEVIYGILLCISVGVFYIIFVKNYKFLQVFPYLLAGITGILLPRILFDIRHGFLMTKTLLSFSGNPALPGYGVSFLNRFVDRLQIFFSEWTQTVAGKNSVLGIIALVLASIVFVYYKKKIQSKELFFLRFSLLSIICYFSILVLFPQPVWSHYTVGLPLFYCIFFSLVLNILKKQLYTKFIYAIIIVFLFFIMNPFTVISEARNPLWEGDASVYRNQIATIEYIYSHAKGKPFKYVLYTPPVYDYTFTYLFSWYGKQKYGYIPSEKASLFFVILEPDKQYPFRQKEWLKLRENDGKIVKEEMIKGGILVQTRIYDQK